LNKKKEIEPKKESITLTTLNPSGFIIAPTVPFVATKNELPKEPVPKLVGFEPLKQPEASKPLFNFPSENKLLFGQPSTEGFSISTPVSTSTSLPLGQKKQEIEPKKLVEFPPVISGGFTLPLPSSKPTSTDQSLKPAGGFNFSNISKTTTFNFMASANNGEPVSMDTNTSPATTAASNQNSGGIFKFGMTAAQPTSFVASTQTVAATPNLFRSISATQIADSSMSFTAPSTFSFNKPGTTPQLSTFGTPAIFTGFPQQPQPQPQPPQTALPQTFGSFGTGAVPFAPQSFTFPTTQTPYVFGNQNPASTDGTTFASSVPGSTFNPTAVTFAMGKKPIKKYKAK